MIRLDTSFFSNEQLDPPWNQPTFLPQVMAGWHHILVASSEKASKGRGFRNTPMVLIQSSIKPYFDYSIYIHTYIHIYIYISIYIYVLYIYILYGTYDIHIIIHHPHDIKHHQITRDLPFFPDGFGENGTAGALDPREARLRGHQDLRDHQILKILIGVSDIPKYLLKISEIRWRLHRICEISCKILRFYCHFLVDSYRPYR